MYDTDTDVVETTHYNILGLSFSCKAGQMRIYEKTLQAIGSPEFFNFKIDESSERLAIFPCMMNDEGSFRNVDPGNGRTHIINCMGFIRYLYKSFSWNRNKSYLLTGTYNEAENIVEFRLDKAALIDVNSGAKQKEASAS